MCCASLNFRQHADHHRRQLLRAIHRRRRGTRSTELQRLVDGRHDRAQLVRQRRRLRRRQRRNRQPGRRHRVRLGRSAVDELIVAVQQHGAARLGDNRVRRRRVVAGRRRGAERRRAVGEDCRHRRRRQLDLDERRRLPRLSDGRDRLLSHLTRWVEDVR